TIVRIQNSEFRSQSISASNEMQRAFWLLYSVFWLLSVSFKAHQHRGNVILAAVGVARRDQRFTGRLRIVVLLDDLGHLRVAGHLPLAIAAQEQRVAGPQPQREQVDLQLGLVA